MKEDQQGLKKAKVDFIIGCCVMEYVSREQLAKVTNPGVMLLSTDTVYGLHACVDDTRAIDALKSIKSRGDERYFITLISSVDQLVDHGIVLSDRHRAFLERVRPGPYTVLLSDDEGLTRSFRLPAKKELTDLIDMHGPLYSTSANWHGDPTIISCDGVDSEMSHHIDHVVDQGELIGQSSTIVQLVR